VFLFGSYADGTADDRSDLDLLVVEASVAARRHEIARLRRAMGATAVRLELLVSDRATFEAWRRIPGMIVPEPGCPYGCAPAIRFGVRFRGPIRSPPSYWIKLRAVHCDVRFVFP